MIDNKPFDARIGVKGAYQPMICAVTGQFVQGRHNTAITLSGKYYIRVLTKAKNLASTDIEKTKAELIKVLPKETMKKQEATNDKQS